MLTMSEASLVLARINAHHGNMPLDETSVGMLREELLPDMTLREACEAVRRFYAGDDADRWCRAGNLNRIVRRMRRDRLPSDAQVESEIMRLGLTGDAAWLYRCGRLRGRDSRSAALLAGRAGDGQAGLLPAGDGGDAPETGSLGV